MQDLNYQQPYAAQPYQQPNQSIRNMRESGDLDGTGRRIMLGGRGVAHDYADMDEQSLYDSLNQKSYVSRLADEKVNLV